MILNLSRFIRLEEPYWKELEAQVALLEASAHHRLTLAETRRLHYLYERATSDLIRLSSFASAPDILTTLEGIVARAYSEIHQADLTQNHFSFWRWLSCTFPQTFRRHLWAFRLALQLTLLGVALGAIMLYFDPETKQEVLPFSHLQGKPSERVAHEQKEKGKNLVGKKATFAGELMTHNINVSLLNLASGMTYGFLTVVLLIGNGVILGAVSYDYIQDGQGVFLFGWILPHGTVEIPALLIAGQAGFLLAQALIGYGRKGLSLQERFRRIRGDIVTLVAGFCLLLVWAGIIESFFSQYHEPVLPYAVKIVFGLCQVSALCCYLSFAGRGAAAAEASSL